MEHIKVYTTSFLEKLGQRLQGESEEVIRGYIEGRSPSCSVSDTKDTILEINDFPELDAEKGEFENAQVLYEALMGMDRILASDQRLWAWLAHVPFMKYMAKRWPVPDQSPDKQAGYILRYWFVGTQSSSSYMRHGIAKLWWGAHMTHDSERDNPFELTGELFSMEDYTRTLFGKLGRSDKIVHAILEFVVENPELFGSHKEARIRFIMRRLNFTGGYKVLPSLLKSEIKKLLENYKNDIEKIID